MSMDEALARRVEDEVLRRLNVPAALLAGSAPPETLGYRLVREPPCEAVIVGSLEPGELLAGGPPAALDALLRGLPVYLWEPGLRHRAFAATANRALWARLQGAERELRRLGVRFYGAPGAKRLVTAEQARALKASAQPPPPGAVFTPLAREILEKR